MALKVFWDQNGTVVQNVEWFRLSDFQTNVHVAVFMFGQQFKANIRNIIKSRRRLPKIL